MKSRLLVFIIILFLLIDLAYFYPKLTGKATYERIMINVTRAIDGDTLETNDFKVRLLGVNTPEKSQRYYEEAKNYLKELEGKEVELEKHGEDKYGRELGYILSDKILINRKILEKGLGSLYYYEKDAYFSDMKKAEESARKKEKGIWKKSTNYGCVELVDLKYFDEEGAKNQEQIILKNNCQKIRAVLKDDATHIYNIDLEKGLFVKNFTKIWNDNGDSIYLSDENGLLLFYRYGQDF